MIGGGFKSTILQQIKPGQKLGLNNANRPKVV